jgi:hypothetical protein
MQVKAEDIKYIKGHAFRNYIDFIPGNITQQVDMLSVYLCFNSFCSNSMTVDIN